MNPKIHLILAGALQIALALFHFTLPGRFQWHEDLARLSLLNRQIFWVHTFFIMLVLVLFGLLSIFGAKELVRPTSLSRMVLAGITFFWVARLFCQFFVYSPELWRGNTLFTVAHVLFSLLWAYFIFAYANCLVRIWSRGA